MERLSEQQCGGCSAYGMKNSSPLSRSALRPPVQSSPVLLRRSGELSTSVRLATLNRQGNSPFAPHRARPWASSEAACVTVPRRLRNGGKRSSPCTLHCRLTLFSAPSVSLATLNHWSSCLQGETAVKQRGGCPAYGERQLAAVGGV